MERMPKEIFDQYRPRSAMARGLDEAFAGCDQWTLAPPSPRRSTLDIAPWLPAAPQTIERASSTPVPESRAA
jgi:hypothetical protein